MKYKSIKILLLIVFVNINQIVGFSQSPIPYKEDIEVIRKFDNIYPQPKHPILFVGSSSIRLWIGFQEKFARYGAMNRGIGGAVINDIVYWADDLIFKYQPRKIVLYVGENDIPHSATTPDSVLTRTVKLFNVIREKLPDVPIVYICPKPSPSRDAFREKTRASLALLKNFMNTQSHVTYLDIYTPMLKAGNSRPELFLEDMLHMNEKGYAIWEKKLKRQLR